MTMTSTLAEDRIAGIEKRLDFIVEELAHMNGVDKRVENQMGDLTVAAQGPSGDAALSPDIMNFPPRRIAELLKAEPIDVHLVTTVVQQLQSAADLIEDIQPVIRDVYIKAVAGCQVLQGKGYFEAAASGMRIGDTVVRSLSVEDLKQVEASVPQLLGFMRNLTHPKVLKTLESMLHGVANVQPTINVDSSISSILRGLASPESRRGIAILLGFLKVVGVETAAVGEATKKS